MRRKLLQRTYLQNGYYHIFNRGNGKQDIFHSPADYAYFLNLLDRYLAPKSMILPKKRVSKTYANEIQMIAYCLMPNHFHLLIQQLDERSMSEFLQSISTCYTTYRHQNQNLVGHTFQDNFKARLIEDAGDLLNTSRYIHRNPKKLMRSCADFEYSSAQYYVGARQKPIWLNTQHVYSLLHRGFGITEERCASSYSSYLELE